MVTVIRRGRVVLRIALAAGVHEREAETGLEPRLRAQSQHGAVDPPAKGALAHAESGRCHVVRRARSQGGQRSHLLGGETRSAACRSIVVHEAYTDERPDYVTWPLPAIEARGGTPLRGEKHEV